jgi:hypothetical protein
MYSMATTIERRHLRFARGCAHAPCVAEPDIRTIAHIEFPAAIGCGSHQENDCQSDQAESNKVNDLQRLRQFLERFHEQYSIWYMREIW